MAVKTIKVDDLDGITEDGVTTVEFAYQGQTWAIDLAPSNVAELEGLLDGYIAAATPVAATQPPRFTATLTTTRRRNGNGKPRNTNDAAQIREWALANGHAIGDRGRIPAPLRQAYNDAQGAVTTA